MKLMHALAWLMYTCLVIFFKNLLEHSTNLCSKNQLSSFIPSTEIHIEQSLENFIGQQCNSKLGRGSKNSSWIQNKWSMKMASQQSAMLIYGTYILSAYEVNTWQWLTIMMEICFMPFKFCNSGDFPTNLLVHRVLFLRQSPYRLTLIFKYISTIEGLVLVCRGK